MKKIYKIVIATCFLFLSMTVLAQGTDVPGQTDTGTGTLEGTDAQESPIDKNLWIVLFLGIGYSFYLVKKNQQIEN